MNELFCCSIDGLFEKLPPSSASEVGNLSVLTIFLTLLLINNVGPDVFIGENKLGV